MRSASPLFAVRKYHRTRRQQRRLPDLTAELESIPSRHHDIENEKGGPLPFRFRDHGVAGWKYFDRESRPFQVMAQPAPARRGT